LGIRNKIRLLFRAVEAVGGAGAALVDEHDVALAQNALEGSGHRGVEAARRLAGTAGEHEQRVRLLAAADGRDTHHRERDAPAVGLAAPLPERSNRRIDGTPSGVPFLFLRDLLVILRCHAETGPGERARSRGSRAGKAVAPGHSASHLDSPGHAPQRVCWWKATASDPVHGSGTHDRSEFAKRN